MDFSKSKILYAVILVLRIVLGAIFVYQLALLYRCQHDLPGCVGLKPFLKAA